VGHKSGEEAKEEKKGRKETECEGKGKAGERKMDERKGKR